MSLGNSRNKNSKLWIPGMEHWCLWKDISFRVAFGHNMPPITCLAPRRLHCSDPKIVSNYQTLFKEWANPLWLFPKKNNFSLSLHTFFSQFPWRSDFGFKGLTLAAQTTLAGD
jgi:hypothetical protein